MPGEYTVRLAAGGRSLEQRLRVEEDPRITVAPAELRAEAEDLLSTAAELRNRISTLYREVGGFTGPITADQRSQIEYYPTVLKDLEQRVTKIGIQN